MADRRAAPLPLMRVVRARAAGRSRQPTCRATLSRIVRPLPKPPSIAAIRHPPSWEGRGLCELELLENDDAHKADERHNNRQHRPTESPRQATFHLCQIRAQFATYGLHVRAQFAA